ncbi:DUF4294 domain-containing protein [Bacteroidota bacterium]|nr:DUF4294 domain-containing protein [Bacteroidota bacterium]MDC3230376.1 DUF4294 domain-containing protein [Bacteroidota bacterium]
MRLRLIIVILSLHFTSAILAQDLNISTYDIIDGDTIINSKKFPELDLISFKTKEEKLNYYRTKKRIKKVYPIALFAKNKLDEIRLSLDSIPKNRKKRKFRRELGKWIKNEYEPIFRKMSIKDGRILIKLVYRETNYTTYELVKDYRGRFSAFFWQRVIKAYDNDLKMKYNPIGNSEDELIESILNELILEGNFVSK